MSLAEIVNNQIDLDSLDSPENFHDYNLLVTGIMPEKKNTHAS